ncbi:hypothetical protein, partial [Escherichia coli]|uniref:hypothetical protein n=1 Tax=Escherichia coli TaxID=562 RepID=UPI002B25590D
NALILCYFFFEAKDGLRDAQEFRGLGDVYKGPLVRVETELQRGANPVGTPGTARLFSGRVPSAFDANYGFDSHIHS